MSKTKPAITGKVNNDQANDAFAEFRKDTALLGLIADASPASIMLFKAVRDKNDNIEDLEFLFINRQARESIGRRDMPGKLFGKEFPYTQTTGLFEHYVNVIETGKAWSDDTYYFNNGIECWAKVNVIKLGDGCLVSYLDITEHKKATDELLHIKEQLAQNATDKYYKLFNSIEQGFCILEVIFNEQVEPVDFRYIAVNPAFEIQSGLKDVVGKTLLEIVPGIEPIFLNTYRSVAVTGESIRVDGYIKQLEIWFDVYAFRIDQADHRHIAVLFSDITERKRTEELLKKNEERQAYLLKLSDAIRTLADPVHIQSAAARIVGQHLNVDRAMYAEKTDKADKADKAGKDGIQYFAINDVYQKAGTIDFPLGLYPVTGFGQIGTILLDGNNIVCNNVEDDPLINENDCATLLSFHVRSFIAVPLIKENKLVAAFCIHYRLPRVWTMEEITLVKETAERTWSAVLQARAEEALRLSEEKYRIHLEHEVNERTEEVKKLNYQLTLINRELEARNTELKTFNSIAANDYNETLRHLYTSMEYIISNDARQLSDAGRANIRRAQASIQKMKLLTEDIVSYTKLHEVVKKKEPVNLDTIIENVLSDFEKKMDVSAITVNCGKMPLVTGYPFLISLLFHHLIDNAIKFSKDNINLVIKISCNEWVKGTGIDNESAQPQMQYHVVSVTDNGIGFSPQHAKRLFEIFYRVSDKSKYRGSGIGLAVCQKIMQMHYGFITTKSEPGAGSTFHCYFPVKETSTVSAD